MTSKSFGFWFLGLSIFFLVGRLPVRSEDAAAPVYRGAGGDLSVVEVRRVLPTVTVRGFLNFRTTIDNTVIVFTPANGGKTESPKPSLVKTRVPVVDNTKVPNVAFTQSSKLHRSTKEHYHQEVLNNVIPTSRNLYPARTQSPLSRSSSKPLSLVQPSRGSPTAPSRALPAQPLYPTGLVTILGGTLVEDGITTVHETSVIGTYIDGKYAQILQSTSRIIFAASSSSVDGQFQPSPTPAAPQATTSTISVSSSKDDMFHPSSRDRKTFKQIVHPGRALVPLDEKLEGLEPKADDSISSNTVLQSSFKPPELFPHRLNRPTQSLDTVHSSTMVTLATRPRQSSSSSSEDENTVFMRRHHRRPSSRFQYTPRRRNTNTVRLNRFKVKLSASPEKEIEEETLFLEEDHTDSVEPDRVIYERTTLTSEVTLHVGRRKSVRTLTITTTVPRTLEPTEVLSNGLFESINDIGDRNNLLIRDSPSLTVISRTYSTIRHTSRTSLIPVFDGKSTRVHTVTESFVIRKIITAYKTMPPANLLLEDDSDFEIPDEIGFSLQSTLLPGIFPIPPSPQQHLVQTSLPRVPGIDDSPLNLGNPLLSLGAALSRNPLAALYLGLQQLNQQVTHFSTITKTSSYVTAETVYNTKVVSIYDGRAIRLRTLSEPLSTTERTLISVFTTVRPMVNTQPFQQQQQFQQLFGSQLQPSLPPRFSTITSTYTTVTTATSTKTRVYTLIYNAFSTKYRTVTSTSFHPTTVTTYSTIQVSMSAAGSVPFYG
ncbi:uncharacterized protein LOC143256386 [Tachypleus tridentatus]|uniref:uncharacterized protein LOC143256386 n=1 Tax=Tachypleus tridentatus TaxID=6853 RepID=UPI003FD420FD